MGTPSKALPVMIVVANVKAIAETMTLNVVVPVVIPPMPQVQDIGNALAKGMDEFALNVENKMLPTGVSAFTAGAFPPLRLSRDPANTDTPTILYSRRRNPLPRPLSAPATHLWASRERRPVSRLTSV